MTRRDSATACGGSYIQCCDTTKYQLKFNFIHIYILVPPGRIKKLTYVPVDQLTLMHVLATY
jgi:hypothetical protein